MFTPDNPVKVYARNAQHAYEIRKDLAQIIKKSCAVAVWPSALIGGRPSVWFTSPEDQKPDWKAGTPQIIPSEEVEACIKVLTPAPCDTVTRTFIDLELFLAAAMAQKLYEIELKVCDPNSGVCEELDPEDALELVANGSQVITGLSFWLDRQVYNSNGYHIGAEKYHAWLPVVRHHADIQKSTHEGRKWLVQVDDSALECGLADHPPITQVVAGRQDPYGKFWSDGALKSATEDELLPKQTKVDLQRLEIEFQAAGGRGVELADEIDRLRAEGDPDTWMPGYEVNGEFFADGDFEEVYVYELPPSDFIYEEMRNELERLRQVGARRVFNSETRTWVIVDAYGEPL